MSRSSLELLCHHEAAHAAVAHHLGLRLHAVWIDPEADDGQTQVMVEPKQTRLQHTLILAASGCAERILDPEQARRRIATVGDESALRTVVSERMDVRLIHRPLDYCDAIEERMLDRVIACSHLLVVRRWPALVRLAGELRTRHRIEGPEAETILAG
jgi:hypothetical protein